METNATTTQEVNATATTTEVGAETLTLTKEELATMLQKEADKRVTQAVKTAKLNWETEMGTKIDSHLKDYEKKASMTPEQLRALDLEEKFKMLEQKEQSYTKMTRELEISKKLSEKKLSTVLAKFVYADADAEVDQNIATLEQLVLGMVNEEVEKRISSTKTKASVNTNGLDKEGFKKLTIAERSELFRTNPTLFKELSR